MDRLKEGAKMTRKEIMTNAWALAKTGAAKFGGSVKSYIAAALQIVWKESKIMESYDIMAHLDELTAKGFNRWTKGNMDRLYINASMLGLNCVYRRTGSISDATFQGYSISNSEALRMKSAKTFIDIINRQIVSDNATLAHAVADLIGITVTEKHYESILKIA